ncbi:MAG TPA: hypothetical protein VFR11_01495 [Micromonosporaceae bacterium]|jgi:hypothetical protein|nr:hypothetical protein [Micromonosporaceae bacterium]
MGTSVLPTAHASHRGERGRYARVLLGLEIALCVGAAGGADYLISEPHTAMPAEYLSRTPFSSWTIPGVLLAVCVAVPAGVVAFGAATRRTFVHVGHPLVGLTLIGWIVVQVAVLGPISVLQPAMFACGLAIGLLGVDNYRGARAAATSMQETDSRRSGR